MKTIVEKLVRIEREISDEKGPFALFAFFLREDAPDLWDLIVSAPWISKDKAASLKYIARRVQEILRAEELIKLSRIVIVDQDNPALEAINRAIHIQHGSTEILNGNFFGLQIKQGYIITSRGDELPPPSSGMQSEGGGINAAKRGNAAL
jgi:hypothetical protein